MDRHQITKIYNEIIHLCKLNQIQLGAEDGTLIIKSPSGDKAVFSVSDLNSDTQYLQEPYGLEG